jgi:hypothetical protein
VIAWLRPGIIVAILLVLATSQLLYALWLHRERGYLPVLVLTSAGFLIGQGWQSVGLPAAHVGEANLLPAIVFAVLLQPLGRFLPRRLARPPRL